MMVHASGCEQNIKTMSGVIPNGADPDMVEDKTHDGKKFRILNIIDEYSRECLMIFVSRRIRSGEVKDCLIDLFIQRGIPEYIRSDNGSEFIAMKIQEFLRRLGTQPTYIEPGSPWENERS